MPGQISIVGFSRFMFRTSCSKLGHANVCSLVSHLPLVTRRWQNASHENIHVINHNSFRHLDRDFLIRAKPCHIAGDGIESGCGPTYGSNRTAESAGDDETDEREVEAQ